MKPRYKQLIVLLILAVLMVAGQTVMAQCPMCRSAVESAMQQEGNTVGVGLNKGILYLLATPYLVVAVVGGIWYRNHRRNR
ncbi:MAG: hypothetical protein GC181_02375 [Bacteroidetes bacterium]|nr:hypothetical protein [Bacteroidota bacterium]